MKSLFMAALLTLCSLCGSSQSRKMVAVGSSTTAGQGTFPLDSSWVNRFNHYYKYELRVLDSTYNLGVGGYSCYKGMPSSYIPPPNRPGPDGSKNVTRALINIGTLPVAADGVIIVNFPTNGYDTFTVAEVMISLQTIYDSAVKNGNKCFITTTQPRSDAANHFNTSAAKRKLAVLKDSILNRFGIHAINFYDGMFNPADSTISAQYAAGDSIHYNNAGHRILFNRVVAKNIFNLDPLPLHITQFSGSLQKKQVLLQWTTQTGNACSFTIQRSNDAVVFQPLSTISIPGNASRSSYDFADKDPLPGTSFYRLQLDQAGGKSFSAVISIKNVQQPVLVHQMFPVPAKSFLHLKIYSTQRQNISLDIVSAQGIVVKQFNRVLEKDESVISLPTGTLKPGAYFLRLYYTGGDPTTFSFTK